MKLESIKNEKFVMSNNEMGLLVGGQQVITGTDGGQLTARQASLPWAYSYSSDCTTTTTTENGTTTSSTTYYGYDYDSCVRDCQPCAEAKKDSITR